MSPARHDAIAAARSNTVCSILFLERKASANLRQDHKLVTNIEHKGETWAKSDNQVREMRQKLNNAAIALCWCLCSI